jgi:hypothetical protein
LPAVIARSDRLTDDDQALRRPRQPPEREAGDERQPGAFSRLEGGEVALLHDGERCHAIRAARITRLHRHLVSDPQPLHERGPGIAVTANGAVPISGRRRRAADMAEAERQ